MSSNDDSSRVPLSVIVTPEHSVIDPDKLDGTTSPRNSELFSAHTHHIKKTLSFLHSAIPYTVHVAAGSPPATSPTTFLVVTMIGEHGSAPPIQLEPVGRCHSYSADGKVETFSVEGAMVGDITSIKVCMCVYTCAYVHVL